MSKMVMVNGYYNGLPYSQKHNAANIYPAAQPWQWGPNYQNHQFLGDLDAHHHQMYYNPHMLHSSSPSEWHSPAAAASSSSAAAAAAAAAASAADNFSTNAPSAHQMLQSHHHHSHGGSGGGASVSGPLGPGNINNSSHSSSVSSAGSNSTPVGPTSANINDNGSGNNHIREQQNNNNNIGEGLSSPPITVSGSEISSPGVPATSTSPHNIPHHIHHNNNNSPSAANNNIIAHSNNNSNHGNNRESPVKTQYYDWMKKPSYPTQPTPGKTRTKDKYRVVYTDYQRLELEKEYCTSRYITIRRKTELAANLGLSERQVKIWFQNRRAKERKQNKKSTDGSVIGSVGQHNDYANIMDTKPKLEPGLHLQHSLHSMSSLQAMGIPSAMGLHHLHHGHHPLAVSAVHPHHHMNQSQHSAQMSAAAAAASVGSMSM